MYTFANDVDFLCLSFAISPEVSSVQGVSGRVAASLRDIRVKVCEACRKRADGRQTGTGEKWSASRRERERGK